MRVVPGGVPGGGATVLNARNSVASVELTRRFVVVSPKAIAVHPAAPGTVPGVQGPQIWTVAAVNGDGVAGAFVWYACNSTKFTVQPGPAGTVTVQTKGDANEAVDPWTAQLQGDTAYQVRAVIPEAGHLIQALRNPTIAPVLLYGAPTLLVGWLLLGIWRPTRDDKDQT